MSRVESQSQTQRRTSARRVGGSENVRGVPLLSLSYPLARSFLGLGASRFCCGDVDGQTEIETRRRQKRLRSSGQNDSHALAHTHANENFPRCSNRQDSRRGEGKGGRVQGAEEGRGFAFFLNPKAIRGHISLSWPMGRFCFVHGMASGWAAQVRDSPKPQRTPARSGYCIEPSASAVRLSRPVFVLGIPKGSEVSPGDDG